MDNQALMGAIDQLKQGIDALAAAVGGGEGGGLEKPPVNPEAGAETPTVSEEEGVDETGAGGPTPPMRGKAVSVEDFLNKKAVPRA